jgi:nucleotide-binding universal stress UspA family protein
MDIQTGIERVLVPVDLEPGSDLVFAHALKIALCSGATLTAMHVHDDPERPVPWTSLPTALDLLVAWGVLQSGATEQDVARLGLHVAQELRPDPDAREGIVRAAREVLPGVIVVGTHRRRGWERLRRGSVAENIARRAGVVTLFVPSGVRPLIEPMTGRIRIRQVILPLGGRGGDLQPAVDTMAALLMTLGVSDVRITALHAGPDPAPDIQLPRHAGWTRSDLRRPLPVVEAVLGVARDRAADLVVMATRGHDSLTDAVAGSITEQVIRRAPCPVLAIPLGSASEAGRSGPYRTT